MEGLAKLSPELKELFERFKALPKKYLAMSVQELEKEIKALQEFIKYRQAYFNTAAEAQSKLLKDLEQLKKLKDAGMSAEQITRAVERFNRTQETIKKVLDLIKGPLEMLRASGAAVMEGVSKFVEGIGKILEALVKFIPFGTKVFGLSKALLENLGPVAVLIDSFETAIHLYDKAKTGKLGAEEITTALTTLVLRAIGWLGGLLVLPLAFLRRESIQDNIEKIFQSENIVEKITRMLLFPIDIIVKALGDTMAGLADIGAIALKIVRKISGFFGGDKEKGFLELFLENFSAEIKKNIENFNLATLTMSIGEKIGEFIFDMVSSVLTWLREKADTLGTAKNWLLSKMGFNKDAPVVDNKVPEFEPQKANDFISRPGQKAIIFSSDDTIMGVKNPDGLNKKLIGELVKKIEDIRKEDRVTLIKLSDSITKLSTTTQANNNVNMVNNSRNVTSITISPTTSKSYRDSRMS
jgi:tetratricopeptide (TPR) repeat protein